MYEGMEQKIAVALLYDRIKAPTLTAKGSGDFAEEIVRKAELANVPITEDKLLAATLAQLELNEEITIHCTLLEYSTYGMRQGLRAFVSSWEQSANE